MFFGGLSLGVYYRLTNDLLEKVSEESTYEAKTTNDSGLTYMIYYGELSDAVIEDAKQYDIVIVHPKLGNITREQVKEIQKNGTYVMGYLSVGEDLRTAGMMPEQMLNDERFTGDGSGPRVDPRDVNSNVLDVSNPLGNTSPQGSGYASYYLDDNDHNGKPDFNPGFGCAYTNIGDSVWYDVLNDMTLDGVDGVSGIREILSNYYGRGLGCDGLFLDTIDTCAPNAYTDDQNDFRTRFEWTATGVAGFMERLKKEYPDKYIIQNRGLFFFNYTLPHFEFSPRKYVDFLMYESYMLDSNTTVLYNKSYFADNKYVYAPKIIAEANRPDGFQVLSLGYAEGPKEYQLKETLLGDTAVGLDILLEDMKQAQDERGFSHYITDSSLTLLNDFVIEHTDKEDSSPPIWSSVHNNSTEYPREKPVPRVGIGEAEPIENGMIVRWDVAIDKSGVIYTLYYQKEPFDFKKDFDLETAQKIELTPELGEGYGYGANSNTYPYQETILDLDAGEDYYFVIRARDCSSKSNEEKNTIMVRGIPLK